MYKYKSIWYYPLCSFFSFDINHLIIPKRIQHANRLAHFNSQKTVLHQDRGDFLFCLALRENDFLRSNYMKTKDGTVIFFKHPGGFTQQNID